MFACDDSASIFCARLMRGTPSMPKLVTRARGEAPDQIRAGERVQERRAAPSPSRSRSDLVERGFLHLQDHVGLAVQGRGVRHDPRAGLLVGGVRVERAFPGTRFHQNLEADLDERGRRVRRQRDAALAGDGLFRDRDLHEG